MENLSLVLGPVAQYHENSAYYSAQCPKPNAKIDGAARWSETVEQIVVRNSSENGTEGDLKEVERELQIEVRVGGLPHIMIQCPVYKESLELTIAPSVYSIKKAMQTYDRLEFYANHNIGWVACPRHSSGPGGFKRAGKLKKSGTVKKVIDESGKETEEVVYHRPWAGGTRSLRVGEIILIIDADTVVPENCFRDAAWEMDVMQVARYYFENGITRFTRRIHKCISYGCANGEVAPFVGHNVFLQWKAVQDTSFIDPADGRRKMWSEANISEDFDFALRLLLTGYTLRWARYSQGGFEGGVSLTMVDELARWQKYVYGCDEIIFNQLIKWWRHGRISKQLREFMQSAAPVHYKIGESLRMSSCMFSYYGIVAATIGSILNYLLLGLGPDLDRFYLHSFEILLACVVVFPSLGNLGFTMLEYRLGHRSIWSSAVENLRWVPFLLFFFGGLSTHLSTAMLVHLFSYDMTWGSTGKEVEKSTFWIEVPRIIKNFKLSIIICLLLIAMMVVFTTDAVPFAWQILGWDWALIIPLSLVVGCHLFLPIVLNLWLMKFSYQLYEMVHDMWTLFFEDFGASESITYFVSYIYL
ncbi:glycosyl transferase family group 2-domain-containing protein [Lentinula edodes]|uniref:glycosyl transferase family group 2-domain-containing protein n=1 Tax=Lentinula edodes TaxID=5353 RepID=UPI001E8D7349|nr:glycosyl transferase family group 2-domain-containing protein [Lentinula edodes]KAH7869394.1 glycosyl transferase family group 2-domain-containing protein [Lentinula edodes]